MRKPDYRQLQKVLSRQRPDRPTLFEFFLNGPLFTRLTGIRDMGVWGSPTWGVVAAKAYASAGYDYVTVPGSTYRFETGGNRHEKSISQNEGAVIWDRESFRKYRWTDPLSADYSALERSSEYLPEGMKVIPFGPSGVLENCISLCGYENLAMMVLDDPQLAGDVFEAVGSRLEAFYRRVVKCPNIVAVISNDDWGFAQQTMLSPADMRRFVFPWHQRIVRAIHEAGYPAILHSCGNLAAVMDDVIGVMKYDAKHSYEDKIMPVEEAYVRWGGRIATLGGIDVDFVCRNTPQAIHERSLAMLKKAEKAGGYALGTGNSVPEYVPTEKYLAMIQAANPQAKFVV